MSANVLRTHFPVIIILSRFVDNSHKSRISSANQVYFWCHRLNKEGGVVCYFTNYYTTRTDNGETLSHRDHPGENFSHPGGNRLQRDAFPVPSEFLVTTGMPSR